MTTLVKATFVEEKMTDLSFFEEGKVYKVYYDKDRRNNMIEDEEGVAWFISHLANGEYHIYGTTLLAKFVAVEEDL
ncbi:TPA: hypothetical protein J7703_003689 [Escherichia coli]|uniref:Uncharacterized protein n=2 Tax=Vequintavirus TaxID=1914852 RepID=A0AAE9ZRR0_9CAUD|nr:hypothetical protein FV3_00204 [Escherichia phage FV3]AEZ65340.1 hypothetical protein FV3_00204 [Escherichia phage FV3]WDS61897.1 hypothetical protein YP6_00091 [Escherichia phage YP-6]HAZ7370284.1 hypothetical protein [Escherichia coli]